MDIGNTQHQLGTYCQAPSQNPKPPRPSPNPVKPKGPIRYKGTGADTKILGHPTTPPPTTFKGCEKVYMVQIEALSTPECQDSIQSQAGQRREEHRVVHHVQEEHYDGHIK